MVSPFPRLFAAANQTSSIPKQHNQKFLRLFLSIFFSLASLLFSFLFFFHQASAPPPFAVGPSGTGYLSLGRIAPATEIQSISRYRFDYSRRCFARGKEQRLREGRTYGKTRLIAPQLDSGCRRFIHEVTCIYYTCHYGVLSVRNRRWVKTVD